MFLFTDSQIVDEKMLVYVNDLLSSGEIPDLFAQEDKDEIINAVRSETKALGLVDTAENCWSTFIQKVNPGSQLVAGSTWLADFCHVTLHARTRRAKQYTPFVALWRIGRAVQHATP